MNINELLSLFGKDKILKWIFDTPNFYIRPSKYFKDFFSKDKEEKFSIGFFYSAIIILILYIFSGQPVLELTKAILIEIALLIFAFAILSSNKFVFNKIFKTDTDYSNVFYFLWLTKILTIPFQLVFFVLFLKTEMYELLFIHNSILALLLIFIIFFSNKIFYHKLKLIALGILYNFIIYNVFIVSISLIKFDKHYFEFENPLMTDYVYKEYKSKIAPLDSLTDKFPLEKFLINLNGKYFLTYSFERDSIQSIIPKIDQFINDGYRFEDDVIRKMKSNNLTVDSFKYARNRVLFNELTAYLDLLKHDISNPLDTSYTYIIDRKVLIGENREKLGEVKHLTTNNQLFDKYISYIKQRNSFFSALNIADYPLYIWQFFFYPSIVLTDK